MQENFGQTKQEAVNKLDEIYYLIDNFLNEGNTSFMKIKRKLEAFVLAEEISGNTNIAKKEQSFVDTLNNVSSSLNSINGMILAVKEMSNSGIPIKANIEYAKKPSLEYNNLSSVKLWSSFKDNEYAIAKLVDVFDNEYTLGNNGLFYVELVKNEIDQEPSYRENFNIPPYQKDNKTIYLLLSNNFKIKDMDDNILESGYEIKNLRTIYKYETTVDGETKTVEEEKPNMIFVSKNEKNVLCANIIFDICYPDKDEETKGLPKNYFVLTAKLDYNIENDNYSLRVI